MDLSREACQAAQGNTKARKSSWLRQKNAYNPYPRGRDLFSWEAHPCGRLFPFGAGLPEPVEIDPARTAFLGRSVLLEPLESRRMLAPLAWSVGTDLPTPRAGVVAAQAANGTTVVLGGGTPDVPAFVATDPAWQTFMRTNSGTLDASLVSPGVGILSNGGILVFGGQGGGSSAFQYDYVAGDNTEKASMHSSRSLMGFATDENHHIYAIGGKSGGNSTLATVESYDSATNHWTTLAPLPKALYALSAAADGAGHVFAFGGVDASGQISSAVYRYTIATNVWDTVASLPAATDRSAAILGSDAKLYVIGGVTAAGTTANVESYDEASNTWTAETPLPVPVNSEAVTVDTLGRIVIAGGSDASGNPTSAVYLSQRLNQPDAAPVFTSTAATTANPGVVYSYQALTTGNPQPTYSLVAAPAGMTVNANTGLVTWTPSYAQEAAGSNSYTILASNAAGSVSKTVNVSVAPLAPTGLTAAGSSTSTILLAWDASPDPTVAAYNIVQRFYHPNPKGSGGTYSYTTLGSSATNSFTIGGLASGKGGTYLVSAVNSAGVSSPRSAPASATSWTPASFPQAPFYLLGGAVWDGTMPATVGRTVQITLIGSGNPAPSYSVVDGPSTVSIDPITALVSYTPDASEVGLVNITFGASNAAGSATQTIQFQVSPAVVPTITWPAPDDMTYGQTLSVIQLDATAADPTTGAPLSGTWAYTPAAGTFLTPGSHVLSGTFTPTNQAYAIVTGTTTVNVLPGMPNLIIDGGPYDFDGQPHAATVSALGIDYSTPVDGSFAVTYNGAATVPSAPGTYTVVANFTSNDPNYSDTTAVGTLVINSDAVKLVPDALYPWLSDLVWSGGNAANSVRFDQLDATTVQVTMLVQNGVAVNSIATFSGVTGSVLATGGSSNDVIDASGLSSIPATLDGAAGNNTLYGGSSDETLIGGSDGGEGQDGNNVIIAGDGNDIIYGNGLTSRRGETGGDNLIVGGAGNDLIYGNYGFGGNGGAGGQNLIVSGSGSTAVYTSGGVDVRKGGAGSIVVAGTTTLGQAELAGILAEWTSPDTLATRLADISGTNGSSGHNGTSYLIPGATIFDNQAVDAILSDQHGAPSWLFYSFIDDYVDGTKPTDVQNDLA